MKNLFGEEWNIPELELAQEVDLKILIKKAQNKNLDLDAATEKKVLKSKSVSIDEKIALINAKVLKILGKQKQNTLVIKTREQLAAYIDAAIKVGRIDIDTETNNSLDPITCQLMGPCLYYPTGKNAYIPLNHVNYKTKERLAWQLTEQDCKEEFQRLIDAGTYIVMHNGKFDYEVIKCTCDIKVKPNWDTIIAARLLDENKKAGLKDLYIEYIDPTQAKYDIEGLFEGIQYSWIDPEIFALYAATDAMMTDKIFLVQLNEFFGEYAKQLENGGFPDDTLVKQDMAKLYNLFKTVEMPIVAITGDMELKGVAVDQELGARLKCKYDNQLADIDLKTAKLLQDLKPIIDDWRLTKEANEMSKQYEPKNTKKSRAEIEVAYPYMDDTVGKRYKLGKSRAEQLPEDINLASPAQLAILFYDVLKCTIDGQEDSRATGKDEIKAIAEALANKTAEQAELDELLDQEGEEAAVVAPTDQLAYELCNLLLKRRGILKLLTTYIDVIPPLAKHWPDGRIRFHMNSLGTDTGRYSSGGKLKYVENDTAITVSSINIQNIPSKNKEIRLLFKADTTFDTHSFEDDDSVAVKEYEEVETVDGWRYPNTLKVGDVLITDESTCTIINIRKIDKTYIIKVN